MSTSFARATTDERLAELLELQQELRAAAREWRQGRALGHEVEAARHAALRLNHERYVELVPAYRRLAEPAGALGGVPLGFIVDNLLFAGLFKSYDPAWLRAGDFAAMTEWLSSVFTHPLSIDVEGVRTVHDWVGRLRTEGVFVTFSSGTSGRLSFVPRDPLGWRALVTNGASYADASWRQGADGRPLDFDCLVVGPRGEGMGILDAGHGLARRATHAHFLFDEALSADAVRELGPHRAREAAAESPGRGEELERAYTRACEFIRIGARAGRRLLAFGTPFQVRRFCERIAATSGRLPTAPGSLLVTGGGWKSFAGERIARAELARLVQDTLGIERARCLDAYSTSELNCTLLACAHGRYHIPPLVEAVVLDEGLTGRIGRPGHGLLAFLDPFAFSYPGFLITGDQGLLAMGACACGLTGAFIEGEIERVEGMEIRGCGGVLESLTA
jgi:acyl-protein synthetase LuxE